MDRQWKEQLRLENRQESFLHKGKDPELGMGHDRCHRFKATSNYILRSDAGVELYSVKNGFVGNNSWICGTCQYGIMPANGFLYVPPDACACFEMAKVNGLNAIASIKAQSRPVLDSDRLQKGPAYSDIRSRKPNLTKASDWPMYRNGPFRSGATQGEMPISPQLLWEIEVGGPQDSNGNIATKRLT